MRKMNLILNPDELEFIKKLIVYYQVDYEFTDEKEKNIKENIVKKINKISSGIK